MLPRPRCAVFWALTLWVLRDAVCPRCEFCGQVSSEDLHSHFQQWGQVLQQRLLAVCERVLNVCSCACTPLVQIEDARVIMDRENPFRSRGFGFVTFARPEDAETAIKNNHDKEWQVLCVFVLWGVGREQGNMRTETRESYWFVLRACGKAARCVWGGERDAC